MSENDEEYDDDDFVNDDDNADNADDDDDDVMRKIAHQEERRQERVAANADYFAPAATRSVDTSSPKPLGDDVSAISASMAGEVDGEGLESVATYDPVAIASTEVPMPATSHRKCLFS